MQSWLHLDICGALTPLAVARKEVESLILPGQRGLHMNSESDRRRHAIVDTILRLGEVHGVHAVVYDAGRMGTEKARRFRCLAALVDHATQHDDSTIVLDLDQSLERWDRQRMIELTRAVGVKAKVAYRHERRHSESLLSIPDAIAWAWARGGDWRRRVRPVVAESLVVSQARSPSATVVRPGLGLTS